MSEQAPSAPVSEYEIAMRIFGDALQGQYYAVRLNGALHLVHRYVRPGTLWLIAIDETQLEPVEPEDMPGLDTDEFEVSEYHGKMGEMIMRTGKLTKPEWARSIGGFTADDLFSDASTIPGQLPSVGGE